MEFLTRLFDPSGFPARWQCGSGWGETPWLGWLHIFSDLGVWSAYLAIPFVLGYFSMRRKDLPFRKIFLLFGAFILACGTTHLMEAIIFWWPVYRLAGFIKLFTALVSWATVLALFQVVPGVLTMRSPEELEREITARKQVEAELQQLNAVLEQRVQERTQELLQSTEALRAERELLHITLASIGDGVIVTDTQGRVTFLNGVAESLTGWTTTDAAGLTLEHVFHIVNEETRQPVANPAIRALEEGVIVGLANHTLLVARDGTERPIDDSAAPIRGNVGAIRGAVLVFRDIKDRKQAEDALKEADRRKDEFLATLAHELRNPLAPIRNSLEVMKRSNGNLDLIEQSRSTMERQLGQMVRLVDDLIDVSRISRNKLELRKERVELAPIVQHAIEACRPLAERAGHELIIHVPAEPIFLNADAARLAQAFGNLLTNSCKFTEPGGRIEFTVQRVDQNAILKVKDNGIGIAPDKLTSVFEMFTQIDQSLERSQSGLGIGLTLVKRLVEMHDGEITAYSQGKGQGCEFVVKVPLLNDPVVRDDASNTASRTNDSSDNLPRTARRVLVVDDNRDSAMSLAMLLKMTGNDVQTAHDGLEALAKAESFLPDLILLDLGMPKLNGYAACSQMRQQSWGKAMTIIALTGWGQDEDRRKSKEAGFDGHLVKPIDHAALMRILTEKR